MQKNVMIGYKIVRYKDGRLHSVFSPQIWYTIGDTYREPARLNHHGGYYVFHTPHLPIIWKQIPSKWTQYDADGHRTFAVVKCEVWGKHVSYGTKHAYACMRPIELMHVFEAANIEFAVANDKLVYHSVPTCLALRATVIAPTKGQEVTYTARMYLPNRGYHIRTRKDGYNPADIVYWKRRAGSEHSWSMHRFNLNAIEQWNKRYEHSGRVKSPVLTIDWIWH